MTWLCPGVCIYIYIYTSIWCVYCDIVCECLWVSVCLLILSVHILIGASVSEPNTSEFNGEISLIYVYIYCMLYIQCTHTCATCRQYAPDLTTRLQEFFHSVWSCFATCNEHGYSEYFQRAPKLSQDKDRLRCRRERKRVWCAQLHAWQAIFCNRDSFLYVTVEHFYR